MSLRILRGDTVLADGTLTGAFVTDGPKINGQRLLDVGPMLFADRPTVFDRESDADVCTFVISTSHADNASALDHALQHGRGVRGVADLRIELTENDETTVWISRDAGWESNEIPAPTGLGTDVQYRVICPGWEKLSSGAGFFFARRIYGGVAGDTKALIYHGGAAGDTHLNTQRHFDGGTAADRAA